MKVKTNIKKNKLRKLISYIIMEKYGSEIYIFKAGDIKKELKSMFKVSVDFGIIHQILDQHIRKGVIEFSTDYEYTKKQCSRYYRIKIPRDIIEWFLDGKEYGEKRINLLKK